MTGARLRPAIASDDWMREQQVRAELEAEAWRRLRLELAVPEPAPPRPHTPQAKTEAELNFGGSTILKALVRFALAAFAAYLAYIVTVDSRLGEFESWLTIGSAFAITLALSMFGPARRFVHALAEAARWILIAGAGIGVLWLATTYFA